jgi:hypothetical protein
MARRKITKRQTMPGQQNTTQKTKAMPTLQVHRKGRQWLFQKYVVPAKLMLENTEGAIKNGQSRETGNIEFTRPR